MDRRNFIKLTAITGTSATLASCGNPEHQIIRFVPEDDVVPGVAEWKSSVCPLCSAGCAVNARVMEADVETVRNGQAGVVKMAVAKKLEGLASDPVSRGGLCARGQASIQITYHPDRLTGPMKRSGARGSGQFKGVSWDEAIAELTGKLDELAAAADQKSLAFLSRPRRGRRLALATAFTAGFGAPPPTTFELFDDEVLRRANGTSFGHAQLPTFDFGRSRFVISFGADFLGTWNSPVSQSGAYGEMRQGRAQVRGKLVQVEPRMSLTGANADEWIPAKPGTEGVVALGLARLLQANAKTPNGVALTDYEPVKVEQISGVPAKKLERLARELAEFAPAVAVVGGAPLAQTNGHFTALAVNLLNSVLGSVGQPGGLFFTPAPVGHHFSGAASADGAGGAAGAEGFQKLSSAKLLMLDDVNPVFATPRAWKVKDALGKVPFIVSFGSFIDDTSTLADLILPDHSFLESWVESTPESGTLEAVTTVAGPVMKPLHNTRATADVLIEVAGKLKTPVTLAWKTAEEVAKSTADSSQSTTASSAQPRASSPKPQGTSPQFVEPKFDGDAGQYAFHFLPYPSQQFYDGSSAHLPWLQEMPDPLTSAMWSSWVELNPRTAERLHIAEGDVVEIASAHGSLRAPAVIFPGIAPDMIAMPVGQGHETFTQFASGRGANPIAILAPVADADTGALAWAATRVKITRVGGPDRSLILFAGEMHEHPHEHKR